MKALDTTLKALASAGITGGFFALPLGLALAWQADLPEIDAVQTAAPMVALAAVPMTMAPPEAEQGFGATEDAPAVQDSGATGSGEGPALERAPRAPATVARKVGTARHSVARPSAAPETPKKKGRKRRNCETPNPGIDRLGPTHFEVDRGIVEAYAKKPGTLSTLGWVNRHDGSNGKTDGFRLGGLTCGNDLHAAGLRNGDVVHAVNGRPVTSIPEAIWAYTKLRKADEIELSISRKGEARTLRFTLS